MAKKGTSPKKKAPAASDRQPKPAPVQQEADTASPGQGWTNGALPPVMTTTDSLPGWQLHTRAAYIDKYQHHRRWIGLPASATGGAGWTRIGQDPPAAVSSSANEEAQPEPADAPPDEVAASVQSLMAQLCEWMYRAGWATGTGGGVSIRVRPTPPASAHDWRVFVAPSGIQKEDMIGQDIFEMDMHNQIVQAPKTPGLKPSACTPLWFVVYRCRPTATCVLHTHSMSAVLATLLDPTEQATTLSLTHLEMIKGVGQHAYDDTLVVPIIDNRPTEDLLADQLEQAVLNYPKCNAVLVRRHGLYAWGDTWEQAKTQCESFDYLFTCAVQMKQWLGLDPAQIPPSGTYRVQDDDKDDKDKDAEMKEEATANGHSQPQGESTDKKKRPRIEAEVRDFRGTAALANGDDVRSNVLPLLPRDGYQALVLDIEGCTTSIAFVHDELFPYVRRHIRTYLTETYGNHQNGPRQEEYTALAHNLTEEVRTYLTQSPAALSSEESPSAWLERTEALTAPDNVVAMVELLMDGDVKSATLKALQGDMWEQGYETGQLQGHVYADVLPMLQWMQQHAIPVYIFSSGSVAAQKLLFGHSAAGNLLPYLTGHYDIPTAGPKKEAASYHRIAADLQLPPDRIVFCSDTSAELVAAQAAGWGAAVWTVRPGNAPRAAADRAWATAHSLLQLCGAV